MHEGPAAISVEAPLERLPLFVRGGALLPLGSVLQFDGERELAELTILAYPAERSSFSLYEDDGVTQAYRRGVRALTEITCTTEGDTVTLGIGQVQGQAALPPERRYNLRVHSPAPPRAILLDGNTLSSGRSGEGGNWRQDGPFAVIEGLRQPAEVKLVYPVAAGRPIG
jgi:hypothetical protein